MSSHTHACGHACGCAVPGDPQCVQDALAADPGPGRQGIFAARWPASHPHPDFGSTLPAPWSPVPIPAAGASL